MAIIITSDFSALDAELDRLSDAPSLVDRAKFDTILTTGMAAVIAAIHVDTGMLKKSPKKKSSYRRSTKTWSGTITVGGHANSKVDYAYYEKRRAGHHDYMSVLRMLHPLFVSAMKGALSP